MDLNSSKFFLLTVLICQTFYCQSFFTSWHHGFAGFSTLFHCCKVIMINENYVASTLHKLVIPIFVTELAKIYHVSANYAELYFR